MEKELNPYLQALKDKKTTMAAKLTFHQGSINNVSIVAVYSGVGKVNASIAAQILISKFNVDYIIVSGTAGGMAAGVNVFDTVVCTEVICHDTDNDIYTKYHPWMKEPKFYSDAKLISLAKDAAKTLTQAIHFGLSTTGELFVNLEKSEALCIEMENAAVAHVCFVNNIPFLAVRSISDNNVENGQDAINRNFEKASYQSYVLVKEILTNFK
ncbi:5'-methylthioadenosine/S-adenosylhomocysteine nucleosidase [Anaerocolumna sp. AGMB13025]|uniref:5'-methylthioadenosine/S-adenosylhomocysteine nucleosidase n=1 Tax=Anaerocolumna sp. AGMB13025 TaxID=3039116 RepID=UPI00241D34E3|nr:5'-methylthioadenosine/S-adenosylhomocysteine nucleosidase [Anaerocolumna sp. AGMB13025]WFR58734.1 5'-methylthioadenosine/S-adenosylhomocysteine nucleosidase [Anaerocolumna sp. AGMB13025]